jgi:hypothetical protein
MNSILIIKSMLFVKITSNSKSIVLLFIEDFLEENGKAEILSFLDWEAEDCYEEMMSLLESLGKDSKAEISCFRGLS